MTKSRIVQNGVNAFEQVLEDDAAATAFQAAGGGPLLAPIMGLSPSIYRPDAGLATPYSQQTSFSVEHQIARDLTASASYLFGRGVKLPRTRNINLFPAGPVFGPERVDPRFDNIYQLEDSASWDISVDVFGTVRLGNFTIMHYRTRGYRSTDDSGRYGT